MKLSKQKWFRDMLYRIENNQRKYLGQAKGLGIYPDEKVFCEHQNRCNHRESFHAYDIPSNGGHVRKSEVWEFILWNGHVQTLGRFE